MDALSVGAALAVVRKEIGDVRPAIEEAAAAASEAKSAAAAATTAAGSYSHLDEREKIGAAADNMRYSILQAQVRKLQETVEKLQNQVSALA